MHRDVVEVRVLSAYHLHLRFEDGKAGELDFTQLAPFEGVFAPLKDPAVFAAVRVNPESGAIEWPNGADMDPLVLYSRVTGKKPPVFGEQTPPRSAAR